MLVRHLFKSENVKTTLLFFVSDHRKTLATVGKRWVNNYGVFQRISKPAV